MKPIRRISITARGSGATLSIGKPLVAQAIRKNTSRAACPWDAGGTKVARRGSHPPYAAIASMRLPRWW
jgi:hypothetical protein